MNHSTALITGISTVQGREVAEQLAREGYSLVFVSPVESEVEALAAQLRRDYGVETRVIASELEDCEDAREIYKQAEAAGSPIEVLVNRVGAVRRSGWAEDARTHVNAQGLIRLTRLIALPMIMRGHGRILNMPANEGARVDEDPGVVSFVLSLSKAFARELIDSGVTVTALCAHPLGAQAAQSLN